MDLPDVHWRTPLTTVPTSAVTTTDNRLCGLNVKPQQFAWASHGVQTPSTSAEWWSTPAALTAKRSPRSGPQETMTGSETILNRGPVGGPACHGPQPAAAL